MRELYASAELVLSWLCNPPVAAAGVASEGSRSSETSGDGGTMLFAVEALEIIASETKEMDLSVARGPELR